MKGVPYSNIFLKEVNTGVSADEYGNYVIKNVKIGNLHIIVTAIRKGNKKDKC